MASLSELKTEGFAPDDSKRILIRDTLLEFGTTTTFVFFGTLMAVNAGAVLSAGALGSDIARLMPIAFTFGMTITCLVYATGHLSGGHMNPGVSLLMVLKRQISPTKMVAYWIAQLLGSLVGAALTWGCVSGVKDLPGVDKPPFLLGATTLAPALTSGNGFLLEFLGSTFFYFVIAQVALDKRSIANTAFPPLVIGLSLIIVHLVLISGTGCGVNPARTFGPAIVACMADSDACDSVIDDWWWIYWIGPFAGSFAAAELTHWVTVAGDMENEDASGTDGENENLIPDKASDTKDEHVQEQQDEPVVQEQQEEA